MTVIGEVVNMFDNSSMIWHIGHRPIPANRITTKEIQMEWTKKQLKELGLCPCGKARQKGRAKCSRCRYRAPHLKTEPKITGPIGLDWDKVLWVIQREVSRQMQQVKP